MSTNHNTSSDVMSDEELLEAFDALVNGESTPLTESDDHRPIYLIPRLLRAGLLPSVPHDPFASPEEMNRRLEMASGLCRKDEILRILDEGLRLSPDMQANEDLPSAVRIAEEALGFEYVKADGTLGNHWKDQTFREVGFDRWWGRTVQGRDSLECGSLSEMLLGVGSDDSGPMAQAENAQASLDDEMDGLWWEREYSRPSGLVKLDEEGQATGDFVFNWEHTTPHARAQDDVRDTMLNEVALAQSTHRLGLLSNWAGNFSRQSMLADNRSAGGLRDRQGTLVETYILDGPRNHSSSAVAAHDLRIVTAWNERDFTPVALPNHTARLYARDLVPSSDAAVAAWDNHSLAHANPFLLVREYRTREQAESSRDSIFMATPAPDVYGPVAKIVGADKLHVGLNFRRYAVVANEAARKVYEHMKQEGWPTATEVFSRFTYVDPTQQKEAEAKVKKFNRWVQKHGHKGIRAVALKVYPEEAKAEQSEDILDRSGRVGEFVGDNESPAELAGPLTLDYRQIRSYLDRPLPEEEVVVDPTSAYTSDPFVPWFMIEVAHEEWLELSRQEARDLVAA